MTRNELVLKLQQLSPPLHEELGVAALHVFGSVARKEAHDASDVDLIVDLQEEPTFAQFMDLKLLLEDTLGCRVDLVTRNALRAPMKARVERKSRRVAVT